MSADSTRTARAATVSTATLPLRLAPEHRACVSCCYWQPVTVATGECRRHAPPWPTVDAASWCGDHPSYRGRG